ncbi:hypothetical protein [Clavibacter sp. VKM Ac-2872]|uniref:hypothetical protein n=1 Tax=Clavibacter sp. VKM Ac-2872 TaxID=2783812 RepID=UPI00188BC4E1|nr:hypothetical protein [Clavibacter sp. VKM Ac-2872]MBF4625525.1 hypothetical protein [Clavibacter sp. VKM Ac-2872]
MNSPYEDLDFMANCIARGDDPRAVLGTAVRVALEAERARAAVETATPPATADALTALDEIEEVLTSEGAITGSPMGNIALIRRSLAAAPERHVITEAMIEAAARSLFNDGQPDEDDPADPNQLSWSSMAADDRSRADLYRSDARRILIDALAVAS